METQKINLIEVKLEADKNNLQCATDSYGRMFIRDGKKTIAYVSERNYGVAWRSDCGGNLSTERITTIDQLRQKFLTPTNTPVIRPSEPEQPKPQPTIKPEIIANGSAHLIPPMFTYIPRKLSETGCTDFEEFTESMNKRENVLLIGPTGSGKTALVRFYCANEKVPYRRVSLNGGATVEDLAGHYILKNQETVWIDGIVTDAARKGHCVCIDEINAAPSDVLFFLNPVLDGERKVILSSKDGEVVIPHPDFRVVATCNPTEQGYAGTNEINEALKDRFHLTLVIDYNETTERKILKNMKISAEKIDDIMNFVNSIRELFLKHEIITPFSTRQIINFANMMERGKEKLILNRFRDTEKSVVSDMLNMFVYKNKSPLDEMVGDNDDSQATSSNSP